MTSSFQEIFYGLFLILSLKIELIPQTEKFFIKQLIFLMFTEI